MYHSIVRRRVLASFDHLNRHDYQTVVASFSPTITHSFAGDHALGGTRHTQATARAWYERLFRLLPDLHFHVENVMIAGLPHNTHVAVQFRVEAAQPDGERYVNHVAQFIRLKWGKIDQIILYEDTDKLVGLLRTLFVSGTSEAAAPPITD